MMSDDDDLPALDQNWFPSSSIIIFWICQIGGFDFDAMSQQNRIQYSDIAMNFDY